MFMWARGVLRLYFYFCDCAFMSLLLFVWLRAIHGRVTGEGHEVPRHESYPTPSDMGCVFYCAMVGAKPFSLPLPCLPFLWYMISVREPAVVLRTPIIL